MQNTSGAECAVIATPGRGQHAARILERRSQPTTGPSSALVLLLLLLMLPSCHVDRLAGLSNEAIDHLQLGGDRLEHQVDDVKDALELHRSRLPHDTQARLELTVQHLQTMLATLAGRIRELNIGVPDLHQEATMSLNRGLAALDGMLARLAQSLADDSASLIGDVADEVDRQRVSVLWLTHQLVHYALLPSVAQLSREGDDLAGVIVTNVSVRCVRAITGGVAVMAFAVALAIIMSAGSSRRRRWPGALALFVGLVALLCSTCLAERISRFRAPELRIPSNAKVCANMNEAARALESRPTLVAADHLIDLAIICEIEAPTPEFASQAARWVRVTTEPGRSTAAHR